MDAGRLQEIKDTFLEMARVAEEARRSFAGSLPIWDTIREAVQGGNELLAEVETARVDPLRASLIGILRADGYVVTPPSSRDWSNVSPTCQTGKHALTHGGTPEAPMYYACTCPPQEMAVHPPTEPPPSRDMEPPTFELGKGESLQIDGGPYGGKRGYVTGYLTGPGLNQYIVGLYDDAVELQNLPLIEYDRVFVKSSDPAKVPSDETPANAKSRKPEVPITAAEWTPSKTQISGFLKDKDLRFDSEDEVTVSVSAFKSATMASSPDLRLARWSSTFQAWRKARLTE